MEIKIQDECILCSKKFGWNEVMISKLPENCAFCMVCIEKFRDENESEWIVCEWSPDILFTKE